MFLCSRSYCTSLQVLSQTPISLESPYGRAEVNVVFLSKRVFAHLNYFEGCWFCHAALNMSFSL